MRPSAERNGRVNARHIEEFKTWATIKNSGDDAVVIENVINFMLDEVCEEVEDNLGNRLLVGRIRRPRGKLIGECNMYNVWIKI